MFRSERAGLVRPRRTFIALGYTLVAVGFASLVLSFFTHAATIPFMIHGLLWGAVSLAYGTRSIKNAKVTAGTLTFDGDALSFDGRVVVRRADVRQAFVVPRGNEVFVRLDRQGALAPPLFVRVGDYDEADALLRVLGLDAERTAAEMRIASGMLAWPVWKQLLATLAPTLLLLLPALMLASKSPMLFAAALFAHVAGTLTLSFAPTRVRIGTDGIVTTWLGRTRFIAHPDIEWVRSYDEVMGTKRQRGVRLDLKGGEVVRLPTGQRDIAAADAAQLERRIDEAREAHRRGAAAGTTDLLARGPRTASEWIRYLRSVGAGAVGHRAPAVPREVLVRVVEDSKASATERVSAAIAAVASGDEDMKARVRIAAEATASPKLRVALERIVSGDEAELEAALDELSEERGAS